MPPNQSRTKPKILLLSGYDAASHRHWRNILEKNLTGYHWTQIALPDRHFYWRVRGNSLSFAFEHRDILNQNYDCLIVTSMVDLSTLRGLVPKLANLPTLVYVHENQFAYPASTKGAENSNLIHAQLTSIYTLLCGDSILFNSEYNKQTFFDGANKLLNKMPDLVPKDLLSNSLKESIVLPVPIENVFYFHSQSNLVTTKRANEKIQILWNHRWEFDKQPEVFFDALRKLKRESMGFKLNIIGQSFRKSPKCFKLAKIEFEKEIVNWGFKERSDYLAILRQSDIVVSASLHDFQGLSMLEAIASGCLPIAPDRVAYPEYINKQQLYSVGSFKEVGNQSCHHEVASLSLKLMEAINALTGESNFEKDAIAQEKCDRQVANKMNRYNETYLTSVYREEIEKLLS